MELIYGIHVSQPSMIGRNNTADALALFERKIELIRNAMKGNLTVSDSNG